MTTSMMAEMRVPSYGRDRPAHDLLKRTCMYMVSTIQLYVT